MDPVDTDQLVVQLNQKYPDTDVARLTDPQLRSMIASLPGMAEAAERLDADACYEVSIKWINLDPDGDDRRWDAEQ